MSDLHCMPLLGHEIPETRPFVRAHVFRTSAGHWWWEYVSDGRLRHGPFPTQADAYASAWRMVELL